MILEDQNQSKEGGMSYQMYSLDLSYQKFTRDSLMRHVVPSNNLRPPSGKASDKHGYKGRPKSEQKTSLDEFSAFVIFKLRSESL